MGSSAKYRLDALRTVMRYVYMFFVCMFSSQYATATTQSLVELEGVFVRHFMFIGNQVLSTTALQQMAAPYRNRYVTMDELQSLRETVSRWYIAHGYINSGAQLPDQDVQYGVIRIRLIEGILSTLNITGNTSLSNVYIHDTIVAKSPLDLPLNVRALQGGLLLLRGDPLVKGIKARLRAGTKLGDAVLDVQVAEARRYRLSIGGSNQNPPTLGEYRGNIHGEWRNTTGRGDTLEADYSTADGVDYYHVNYRTPLNRYHTILSFTANKTDTIIVAPSLSSMKIISRTQSQNIQLNHALWSNDFNSVHIAVGYKHRRTQVSILGVPFAFAPNSLGIIQSHSLHFLQTWQYQHHSMLVNTSSDFTIGMTPIFKRKPDGRFIHWLGKATLFNHWSLWRSKSVIRVLSRLANRSLLPIDTFPVGGMDSVRGYRENQLATDNAVVTSVEWRIPILRLPVPWLSQTYQDGELAIAPFIDYAHAWNRKRLNKDIRNLASVGMGLRWQIGAGSSFELYAGKPLRRIKQKGIHYMQDSGIHMRLRLAVL